MLRTSPQWPFVLKDFVPGKICCRTNPQKNLAPVLPPQPSTPPPPRLWNPPPTPPPPPLKWSSAGPTTATATSTPYNPCKQTSQSTESETARKLEARRWTAGDAASGQCPASLAQRQVDVLDGPRGRESPAQPPGPEALKRRSGTKKQLIAPSRTRPPVFPCPGALTVCPWVLHCMMPRGCKWISQDAANPWTSLDVSQQKRVGVRHSL